LGIVNDVLDLSKIEAGKLELEPQSFNLKDLMDEVNSMFNAPMMNKAINFHQEIDTLVPDFLVADRIRLQQLMMNLLSNALKFTADGGDIGFSLQMAEPSSLGGSFLILTVSDSGIGINEARLGEIFDAYQQAEIYTSRIYGGTGLGLSLCRQIVQLMSGDISVTSILGKGSTFTAKVLVHSNSENNEVAAEPDTFFAIKGMKVLVAEDNVTNRKVIEKLLQKLLIDVVVVENGQQLLDCISDFDPDLILMDCHMPVLNGFDTTRELRRRGSTTAIFALTAGVTNEERTECFDIGMNYILTKPVTLQSLTLALQKATLV
jgi:CheY-like chemotaxis protein